MGSAIRSALLSRQVHIYMRPPPRSLSQSLLVLEELQKFGEVATFYNLQYDYRHNVRRKSRSALAIFESADAAAVALKASPITVSLPDANRTQHDVKEHDAEEEDESRHASNDETTDSSGSSSNSGGDNTSSPTRRLICSLHHSEHNHEVTARQNPYHDSFHLSRNMLELQDLLRNYDGKLTPAPHPVFADCFSARKQVKPYRYQARIAEENEGHGDTSLMGLYKKGVKLRGEE